VRHAMPNLFIYTLAGAPLGASRTDTKKIKIQEFLNENEQKP